MPPNVPKPFRKMRDHGRRRANAAVDPGEIILASVKRDHMNVVVDLLGMTDSQSRNTLYVLRIAGHTDRRRHPANS